MIENQTGIYLQYNIYLYLYLYNNEDIIQDNCTFMLIQYYSNIYINKEECL